MELASIVYSTLAIVFFIILVLFVISYLGYKMKQREEPFRNTAISYQKFRAEARATSERKLY